MTSTCVSLTSSASSRQSGTHRNSMSHPSLPDANPHGLHLKLLSHAGRLAEWASTGDTFPVLIEINPTRSCNQGCGWCISGNTHDANTSITKDELRHQKARLSSQDSAVSSYHNGRSHQIDIEALERFFTQAKVKGLKAVTWSGGGEPTTYTYFVQGVEHAATLNLDQGLMTNGMYPSSFVPVIGNHLNWMRISVDTINSVKYKEKRKTNGFNQVISNIERVVKEPVTVGINMNLTDWNVDEILTMAKWARDVGADYFQIRPVLGLPFKMSYNARYRDQPKFEWVKRVKPLLMEAEGLSDGHFRVMVSWDKFHDATDVEGKFGRIYSKCRAHFMMAVLHANGDMCVCMYHLDDKTFSFGNIYEKSVDEIWVSDQRRQVISMCDNELDLSTCQVCCKGHEINKILHQIENPPSFSDTHFL